MCTAKVAAISLLCYLSLVVTISVSAASIRKVQLMEFTPKASDTPTPQSRYANVTCCFGRPYLVSDKLF